MRKRETLDNLGETSKEGSNPFSPNNEERLAIIIMEETIIDNEENLVILLSGTDEEVSKDLRNILRKDEDN